MDFTSFLIVCLSVLLFLSFYLNIILSYKMRKYINKEKIKVIQDSEDLDKMFNAQINELTDDYIFKNSKNEKFESVQDAINTMNREVKNDANGVKIKPAYDYGKVDLDEEPELSEDELNKIRTDTSDVPIITGDKDTDALLEDERIAQYEEPTTADEHNKKWLEQQTNQNNRLEKNNGKRENT